MLRKVFIFVLLLLLISQLSFAQAKTDSTSASLKAADAAWEKAFAGRDIEGTLKFYADDAIVMEPGMPALTGNAAIRNSLQGFFADKTFFLHWTATGAEVAKSGEMGYTRGTFEAQFTDPSGKLVKEQGKYLTVWKKVGGEWKVAVDINNSDLPAK